MLNDENREKKLKQRIIKTTQTYIAWSLIKKFKVE
jgi:hypothetical protein